MMTLTLTFDPCRTTPGNCPSAADSSHVRFHDWHRALEFAVGRAYGTHGHTYVHGRYLDPLLTRCRYRVYFDGTHWRVVNLVTRSEV
jgi:hypothetical protein